MALALHVLETSLDVDTQTQCGQTMEPSPGNTPYRSLMLGLYRSRNNVDSGSATFSTCSASLTFPR
jgi:hypothetical protein